VQNHGINFRFLTWVELRGNYYQVADIHSILGLNGTGDFTGEHY
jgi:hypothetical protein